jgi:hypothetical protein
MTAAELQSEQPVLLGTPALFDGATLRLYGADVLIVVVRAAVLADPYESQLLVLAFNARFRRTIVLVALDPSGVPTYFGPAAIVHALSRLPFEALTWKRYRKKPPAPMLPTPIDPPANETDSRPSWSYCGTPDTNVDQTTIHITRRDSKQLDTRDERSAKATR